MNPNQGEVSRAMRNRCLEIHVPWKEVAPTITQAVGDDVTDDVIETQDSSLDEWKIICESKALNREERDVCHEAYGKF